MKILAMVMAGGNGTRLHPLTAEHAKPALMFAAGYRIVDFVLGNLVNSRALSDLRAGAIQAAYRSSSISAPRGHPGPRVATRPYASCSRKRAAQRAVPGHGGCHLSRIST